MIGPPVALQSQRHVNRLVDGVHGGYCQVGCLGESMVMLAAGWRGAVDLVLGMTAGFALGLGADFGAAGLSLSLSISVC